MNPFKKLLAAGGIAALIIGSMIVGNGEEEITLPYTSVIHNRADIVIEETLAKVGDEITTLRTRQSKTIKLANGKRSLKIYSAPQHYLDSEDGVYKEYDVSVKEISQEAKTNPNRTHDKYVNPGEDAPKTRWFDGKEYDYTFINPSGDYNFTLEALYDANLVTHNMRYSKFGTDLFVVINDKADANSLSNQLSWEITGNAIAKLEANGSITFNDNDNNPLFRMRKPWMRDANLRYYYNNIDVTLHGDTLTYALDIPENAVYPIVIDPSSFAVTVDDTDSVTGFMRGQSGVNYATARDGAIANFISSTAIDIGQDFITGTYYVSRGLMRFDTSTFRTNVTVDSITYRIQMTTDSSALDSLWLKLIAANDSVNTSYFNTSHYNEFEGWAAGSAAYSPTVISDSLDAELYSVNDTLAFTFNTAGLSELNSDGTTQFFLVCGRDMASLVPTGNETMSFDDDNSYLQIWYTDLSTIIRSVLTTQVLNQEDTYTNTRDDDPYESFSVSSGLFKVGQDSIFSGAGMNYNTYRIFFSFPLATSNIATVSACSLYFNIFDFVNPGGDFEVEIIASFQDGDPAGSWAKDFHGWAGSGAYVTTPHFYGNVWNTSGKSTGWNFIPFNSRGIDSLEYYASQFDTLKIALLSSRDIGNNEPTAQEHLRISNIADDAPYLSIEYESIIPTNFTMTALNADTLRCTWDDIYTGEDGYRIIKTPYSGPSDYVDSVGAGVATIDIIGHDPNTLFEYKVQIIDSESDSTSTADSTYTHANIPHTLVMSSPSATTMQLVFNVASNPAYTNFAIRAIASPGTSVGDTSYVDFDNDNLMTLAGGSPMTTPDVDSTYIWGTLADAISINNNDTLTVVGDSGRKYTWQVWALSGSADKR